jgi:hypothetical protein
MSILSGKGRDRWVNSLLRRVVDEVDTLLDVTLEVLVAGLKELLLVFVGLADHVDGLLSTRGLQTVRGVHDNLGNTYAELDWDGEELAAGRLLDGFTTGNTRKVDEAGLDNTLLALDGPDDLLGESVKS